MIYCSQGTRADHAQNKKVGPRILGCTFPLYNGQRPPISSTTLENKDLETVIKSSRTCTLDNARGAYIALEQSSNKGRDCEGTLLLVTVSDRSKGAVMDSGSAQKSLRKPRHPQDASSTPRSNTPKEWDCSAPEVSPTSLPSFLHCPSPAKTPPEVV